jgi:hypothetical protein
VSLLTKYGTKNTKTFLKTFLSVNETDCLERVHCLIVFFFSLFGQLNFPRMVRPIDYAPNCLSFKEVAVCASHKVFIDIDDNSALIVGNP